MSKALLAVLQVGRKTSWKLEVNLVESGQVNTSFHSSEPIPKKVQVNFKLLPDLQERMQSDRQ